MNKLISILAAILFFSGVQQVDAQKRRTTTRKTTTVRKTTTQKQTTSTERLIKEVAFYDVKAKDFCVDANYIYYLEGMPNNAVMKIDRKTGEVSTVIPGIANVYEGRRAVINFIDVAGGKFIFQYGGYPGSVGIVVDGKYQGSKDWEKVVRTKGNYMLIMCHNSGTELYNVKDMTSINVQGIPDSGGSDRLGEIRLELDDNGCVWFPYESGEKFGVVRLTPTGKTTFYDLSTQAYVVSEKITIYGPNKPINWFTSAGAYLYASCKRRIYRLNMLNPTSWEEYAKIPPTLDSGFYQFWPDFNGNILNNDKSSRKAYWFYRVGAFDIPWSLGDWGNIVSGMSKWGWEKIYPSLGKVRVDQDNNYIISQSGESICILNPTGVVGYDKARGKVYKP